ncbi:Alpha/Beta hydrolase protein [Penicillium macrosclerotiorum]|uniref:Alpha/Beta hydrolase protein n=1 Tax=Penicillium macrosclerotiorum TaxID=303699 RepID=UPI002549917D|nr:Alpha/Beta hydrolase protein [Penicillium macrosclerotiorum]KAJ5698709.1 Alpha/Beta hydrolase protein [Penicillium macrosclerotiorum]
MEIALDVESFIQKHQIQSPTIIGHSMGAKTALTVALHSPNLVSNIVAVDNCPIHLPLVADFSRYLEGMKEIDKMQVRTHVEAEEILRRYEQSAAVRSWLLSNFVKMDNSSSLKSRVPLDILSNAKGPLGDFPYRSGEAEFRQPVLFLRALQSHYFPQTAFPIIESFFPNSKILEMNCGHWIVQEKPAQFRKGLLTMDCPKSHGGANLFL